MFQKSITYLTLALLTSNISKAAESDESYTRLAGSAAQIVGISSVPIALFGYPMYRGIKVRKSLQRLDDEARRVAKIQTYNNLGENSLRLGGDKIWEDHRKRVLEANPNSETYIIVRHRPAGQNSFPQAEREVFIKNQMARAQMQGTSVDAEMRALKTAGRPSLPVNQAHYIIALPKGETDLMKLLVDIQVLNLEIIERRTFPESHLNLGRNWYTSHSALLNRAPLSAVRGTALKAGGAAAAGVTLAIAGTALKAQSGPAKDGSELSAQPGSDH